MARAWTLRPASAVMMRVLSTSAGVVRIEASAPARPPSATASQRASSRGCPCALPARSAEGQGQEYAIN